MKYIIIINSDEKKLIEATLSKYIDEVPNLTHSPNFKQWRENQIHLANDLRNRIINTKEQS